MLTETEITIQLAKLLVGLVARGFPGRRGQTASVSLIKQTNKPPASAQNATRRLFFIMAQNHSLIAPARRPVAETYFCAKENMTTVARWR
jgi:hypothetical protein